MCAPVPPKRRDQMGTILKKQNQPLKKGAGITCFLRVHLEHAINMHQLSSEETLLYHSKS